MIRFDIKIKNYRFADLLGRPMLFYEGLAN